MHRYIHTCMHTYITTKHKVLTMDNPARARMIPSTALRMNFDQSSGILDVSAPGHHTHTHTHTHTHIHTYIHINDTTITTCTVLHLPGRLASSIPASSMPKKAGKEILKDAVSLCSNEGSFSTALPTVVQHSMVQVMLEVHAYSSLTHSLTHSLTKELRGAVEQQQACQP